MHLKNIITSLQLLLVFACVLALLCGQHSIASSIYEYAKIQTRLASSEGLASSEALVVIDL